MQVVCLEKACRRTGFGGAEKFGGISIVCFWFCVEPSPQEISLRGGGVMEEFMGLVLLFSVKLRKHYGKSERADGR